MKYEREIKLDESYFSQDFEILECTDKRNLLL